RSAGRIDRERIRRVRQGAERYGGTGQRGSNQRVVRSQLLDDLAPRVVHRGYRADVVGRAEAPSKLPERADHRIEQARILDLVRADTAYRDDLICAHDPRQIEL